ncbi:type VII secretion-associated serine protease mycosin [Streptomyces sp. NPDC005925]|uniref:type VII secretion-associated serine protease mycosin n=1 Tax=Streptomyces sp. NPDC005925 TaxID=3157172 RepID=UPI0033D8B879
MRTSTRRRPRRAAASAVLGLLLAAAAGTQARAEPTREEQWFLDAMKAEQMWQTSTGEGVTVAVIDTGVDPDNPDLKGRVLPGKDLAPDQPGDEHADYEGHGTGMAGLIAGTGAYGGGNGAFGLAPGVMILPVRLPSADTAANLAEAEERFNKAVAPAIRYAADKGAQVINISQAATEGSPQLTAAVKYALGEGSLIFAGVGNKGSGANEVMYPAATPGVVGVAAVGKDLRRTAESEHGPQVDMAAPGEDMVHACDSETGLCRGHGTSDATALASASAALIWAEHPTWTNNQILRVMLNTIGAPTDGADRNDSIGYGIVRPRIALQSSGDPGPAGAYPLPDLAAAASTSPSPQTSETAGADAPAEDDGSAATASAPKDGTTPWVALGIGGVVLLGAAIAVLAVVRRRRDPAAALPTSAPATGRSTHTPTGFTPPSYAPPGTSDSVTSSDRGPGSV